MKRRKRKWVRCGNTHILLELWTDERLPEWQVVGHVMLREIYASIPPSWYAWWTEGVAEMLDRRPRVRDAKLLLEATLDERRGYLFAITEPGPA